MSSAKHVLFVCTGNTCRSPLAEGLFRKATEQRDDFQVSSAGIAASTGSPASPETLLVLTKRGAHLPGFKSKPVTAKLLENATHVFAMTTEHLRTLERKFPSHANKFYLLSEFSQNPAQRDVADPIGMGNAAYIEVADVMEHAMPAIVAYILETEK